MVNNPHLSDLQFQVDSGEVIYAHMFVLYARCPQLMEFVSGRVVCVCVPCLLMGLAKLGWALLLKADKGRCLLLHFPRWIREVSW